VLGVSRRPPRAEAADEFAALDLSQPLPADLGTFDAVVHAAALASPWARPADYRRHNVQATTNVIEFVHKTRVPHLVLISSSSVYYHDGDQFGITETGPFPPHPINAYAASKRECERLVLLAGTDAAILRPRAIFGVGDTVLFPRILRAARAGMLPRFSRAGGTRAVGDLISINNLVHFIARAIETRATGDFNLTDGCPVDIYDFLGSVLAQLGLPAPRHAVPASVANRIAGVFESVSKHLLGWREPPLTRFGVAVFSQSKTFDISKAIAAFGAPPVATETAVRHFVEWQRGER
jgi:nucleoside-diphosphate-sugar epimerase